jgi:AmmeMemoRadiSam system protein B
MKNFVPILIFVLSSIMLSCSNKQSSEQKDEVTVRPLKDTVGFAQYSWQMDSIMARVDSSDWSKADSLPWKLAVCPHDDYTYTGSLYPELCRNVKAKNLILIGVAHGAAKMGIQDSLVFDSYDFWKGPWQNVSVSPVREGLIEKLKGFAMISDSLHKSEHSLEALIPFLQYYNKDITIVPVLVPAMSPARMDECGKALAAAIKEVAAAKGWQWGTDYAIVVTTDAVHYGNEDWGGKDMAFFGCDENGNRKALHHEHEILDSCFSGPIDLKKIRLFNSYTLSDSDYHEYKWTWCGRYCVPVALYTSLYMSDSQPLHGEIVGYSSSITSPHIPVDDLGMGRTAIATECHWVGYAAIGYR